MLKIKIEKLNNLMNRVSRKIPKPKNKKQKIIFMAVFLFLSSFLLSGMIFVLADLAGYGESGPTAAPNSLDYGLVGYWNFEEGSGQTVYDRSDNGNNGTLGANSSVGSDDPVFAAGHDSMGDNGTSLRFDGINDCSNVGNGSSLNNSVYTVSAWIKNPGVNAYDYIYESTYSGSGTYDQISFRLSAGSGDGKLYLRHGDGTSMAELYSDYRLDDGLWHFVVGSFDGSVAKLYDNGNLIKSINTSIIPFSNNRNRYLGSYQGTTHFFDGSIDEVRVYNRAITVDEVNLLYNNKKPALEINMDENIGTIVKDSSFGNYDGTVYGATGTAESGGATTLTDTNKSWTTNEWANETIKIIGGTGLGQTRTVASNTATAVTVSSVWTTNPDATSVYSITSKDEWTSGKQGSAIDFDGTDDYVDLGDVFRPNRTTGRSFSFWVYPDSLSNRTVFSTGNLYNLKAGFSEFVLNSTNITVSYDFNITPYRYSFPVTADVGQWNHFILTVDVSDSINTVLKLYKDGKFMSSMTQERVVSGGNNESFLLGARTSGATDGKINLFDGKIDKFKIYNYTLTEDEASTDYNDSLAAHLGEGNQDLSYGLAGHWNFEEGSGQTVYDKSGNGNNGTLGANSSVGSDDPVFVAGHDSMGDNGTGLKFDGVNDYVDAGSTGNLSAISISAWVYYDGLNTIWKGIVDQCRGFSSNGGFSLSVGDGSDPNKVVFMLADGSAPSPHFTTTDDLPLNQWVHVIAIWDGTTSAGSIKIYFNGIRQSGTDENFGTSLAAATLSTRIGGSNATFPGSIDEVRIYNRTLSEDEIKVLYNQKKPVMHLKMDEGSGNVAHDESFNNNDGTITGATWTEGKFGNALSFDGTDDYVGVSDNSTLDITNEITMGAWIKKSTLGDSVIAGKSGAYLLGFSSIDKVYYNHYNGSSWDAVTYSNHSIIDTNWHYVLVTYSKNLGKVQIYIDGILDGESSNNSTITTNVSQFTVGYLAGWSDNWYFSGSIDDVRVYNYIRTQEEILTDYNEGKSVKLGDNNQDLNSGLVGHWNFEEGAGQTVYDSSGNANNGTLGTSSSVGSDDPVFGGGYGSSGNVGAGLKFDGADDYAKVSAAGLDLRGLTVSMWVNSNRSSGLGMFRTDAGNNILLHYRGAGFYLTASDSTTSGYLGWNTLPAYGKWTMLTATWDGSLMRLYTDGVKQSSTLSFSGGATGIVKSGTYYSMGKRFNDGQNWFDGSIDEVRVYNRAISDDEVRMLYNQKKPILEMKFDEGSGSVAYDESFNNNDGTITGATWTEGKFGNALSFDGSGDYVDLGNSSIFDVTNQATFSAWVKASSISTDRDIIGKQDSYLFRFSAVSPGKLQLILKYGSNWNFSNLSFNRVDDGAWHYVAGVYDGAKMRIYVDGGIGATDTTFSSNIAVTTNNVFVGARSTSLEYFSGSIDEVRIYQYARTADEIKADYNNGLATHLR